MSESNLWQWLSKARKVYGDQLDMSRQENMVAIGQPDVEGCLTGSQFWLELKHSARPVRSSTRLRFGSPIKQNQIDWHRKRDAAGGKVFYLISVGSGHERRIYLVHWSHGPQMLDYGVRESELDAWNLLDTQAPAKVVLRASQD